MTRRSDEPSPPFTPVELEIAQLAGKGYGHWRIAATLKRSPRGIRHAVDRMAAKLQNPDELTPLTLVQMWGAHRRWIAEQFPPPKRSDAA